MSDVINKSLSDTGDASLLDSAREAQKRAYAPYSKFNVGAAVLTSDGRVFHGCNIENASYGLTVCAERTAIFNAVAAGATEIKAIAVVAAENTPHESDKMPCGACRQVISEFMSENGRIILGRGENKPMVVGISDLLPKPFKLV